jgi:hypothetical protein
LSDPQQLAAAIAEAVALVSTAQPAAQPAAAPPPTWPIDAAATAAASLGREGVMPHPPRPQPQPQLQLHRSGLALPAHGWPPEQSGYPGAAAAHPHPGSAHPGMHTAAAAAAIPGVGYGLGPPAGAPHSAGWPHHAAAAQPPGASAAVAGAALPPPPAWPAPPPPPYPAAGAALPWPAPPPLASPWPPPPPLLHSAGPRSHGPQPGTMPWPAGPHTAPREASFSEPSPGQHCTYPAAPGQPSRPAAAAVPARPPADVPWTPPVHLYTPSHRPSYESNGAEPRSYAVSYGRTCSPTREQPLYSPLRAEALEDEAAATHAAGGAAAAGSGAVARPYTRDNGEPVPARVRATAVPAKPDAAPFQAQAGSAGGARGFLASLVGMDGAALRRASAGRRQRGGGTGPAVAAPRSVAGALGRGVRPRLASGSDAGAALQPGSSGLGGAEEGPRAGREGALAVAGEPEVEEAAQVAAEPAAAAPGERPDASQSVAAPRTRAQAVAPQPEPLPPRPVPVTPARPPQQLFTVPAEAGAGSEQAVGRARRVHEQRQAEQRRREEAIRGRPAGGGEPGAAAEAGGAAEAPAAARPAGAGGVSAGVSNGAGEGSGGGGGGKGRTPLEERMAAALAQVTHAPAWQLARTCTGSCLTREGAGAAGVGPPPRASPVHLAARSGCSGSAQPRPRPRRPSSRAHPHVPERPGPP